MVTFFAELINDQKDSALSAAEKPKKRGYMRIGVTALNLRHEGKGEKINYIRAQL